MQKAKAISVNCPPGVSRGDDSMDEKGFREFIKEGKRVPKGLTEKTIRSHIRMVKEFETFVRRKSPKKQFKDAKDRDIKAFAKHLADKNRNNYNNLIGLLRYARYSGNDCVTIALLDILQSGIVLKTMCSSARKELGMRKYEELLSDYKPPGIGTSPKLMPSATSEFMSRMESGIGEEATRQFLLANCPDVGPPEYYAEERKMFLGSKDIDDYLRRRRRKFIKELEEHMKNETLFFNQRIDQDTLDFVRENAEIAGGVRKGSKIFLKKVPYMAIEYLREQDSTKKRYYMCHCPLARESIPAGKVMSHNLCYCSAGFEKRPIEVALGKTLKAKVLKSALWGDTVCRFVLEIPRELLPKKT